MAEVALNDADIGSLVDQSVPARMPQHVRMDLQVTQAGDGSRKGILRTLVRREIDKE